MEPLANAGGFCCSKPTCPKSGRSDIMPRRVSFLYKMDELMLTSALGMKTGGDILSTGYMAKHFCHGLTA